MENVLGENASRDMGNNKSAGVGSKEKRHSKHYDNRKLKLQEAEAILAAELKQKQKILEQENALMRAKEEIYAKGGTDDLIDPLCKRRSSSKDLPVFYTGS